MTAAPGVRGWSGKTATASASDVEFVEGRLALSSTARVLCLLILSFFFEPCLFRPKHDEYNSNPRARPNRGRRGRLDLESVSETMIRHRRHGEKKVTGHRKISFLLSLCLCVSVANPGSKILSYV